MVCKFDVREGDKEYYLLSEAKYVRISQNGMYICFFTTHVELSGFSNRPTISSDNRIQ